MRENESVETLTDLAHVLAGLVEFEQSCRAPGERSIRTDRHFWRAGPRVYEHVSFGVGCHAGRFTHIQAVGQLEEVGCGVERNFRDALRECETGESKHED